MLDVTRQIFGDTVDRLVEIRERIEALKVQEAELEELIKDSGEGRYPGSFMDVLIYTQKRHYVNWKDVVRYLKIPTRVIKRFSVPQDVTCLKIVSKHRKVA